MQGGIAVIHLKDMWHGIQSHQFFGSREFKGRRFYVVEHFETPNPESAESQDLNITDRSQSSFQRGHLAAN
jgi:hypothetical protein